MEHYWHTIKFQPKNGKYTTYNKSSTHSTQTESNNVKHLTEANTQTEKDLQTLNTAEKIKEYVEAFQILERNQSNYVKRIYMLLQHQDREDRVKEFLEVTNSILDIDFVLERNKS